jgi:hypothetical protein
VLDNTIHLDVGAITVATFQTAAPPNMRCFLRAHLVARGGVDRDASEDAWSATSGRPALAADPFGVGGVEPGALHAIAAGDPERRDLARIAPAMLRRLHGMRSALRGAPTSLDDGRPAPVDNLDDRGIVCAPCDRRQSCSRRVSPCCRRRPRRRRRATPSCSR